MITFDEQQKKQIIMKKLVFILSIMMSLTLTQKAVAQNTIVDVAVGNEDFSTLVAALTAADLVGALQSDGPFTVFAPTNAAFAKIDSKTLNSLLEKRKSGGFSKYFNISCCARKIGSKRCSCSFKERKWFCRIKSIKRSSINCYAKR